MSRRLLHLWCIVLSIVFAGTLFAQDRSAMWNASKRVKFGIDAATPARPAQTGGGATLNPLSPPNTPDVAVFAPSANAQSENSIGVNFSSPNQLMVSTNGRIPGSNPVVHQPWAFSTDGGATWPVSMQSEDLPPGILDSFGDPVAFFDRSGRAYYCTLGSPGGIYFVSTTNFGATWSARTNADPNNSTSDDKQHATADYSGTFPNNVYAAWTDFAVSGNPIQFTRSTDQGATWSARRTLGISTNRGQGVHIAIGPTGEVYVMWAHYTTGTAEVGIGFARSTDGGATFNTPAVAYPISGIRISNGGIAALNNVRAASFPYVDVDRTNGSRRGWIYSVTPELVSSQADIFLRRSTDGGTTWSAPIQVNGPDVAVGKWQFMASIAVDPTSGRISVGYYSMDSVGTNFMTNRYMASSVDGGDTWDRWVISDVRANWQPQGTPNTNVNYNGDYYETAAMNGKAWAIWTDRRTGTNKAYVENIQYAQGFGWVRGIARSGGNPLSGATVDFVENLPQQPATSGTDGSFLAGVQIIPPTHPDTIANRTLRIRKFGYRDTTFVVAVSTTDTVSTGTITITPAPSGTLSVFSHTATTNLRSFVEVKFGSLTVVSDSTNATTGLLTAPLPTGTYSVRVDAPAPYATKNFPSVVINAGATTNVDALTRAVVEYAPTAMRDTLPVGGSRSKTLTLTNTTPDSVRFRITDDNVLARVTTRVIDMNLPSVRRSMEQQHAPVGAKGQPDPLPPGLDSPDGRGGPDAFGYQWIDSDEPGGPIFNWFDISTIGTQITVMTSGTLDDGFATITMPWAFPLYGTSYSSLNVGTNGFVNFGTGSTSLSNGAIPSTTVPNNAIYAFWDDLDFRTSGKLLYYNDVANGRFVVQYDKAPRFGSTATDTLTFQIIMKPNGEITYQYLRVVGPVLNSGTIGVENAAGTVALQVVNNAAYVHNNLAVRIFLPDAAWLSENPVVGTIPPNSNLPISCTFDATGLTPGSLYNGKIVLDATHPDLTSPFQIPASLKVNAADSALLVLNKTSITFPGTVIGNVRRDTVKARNQGGTSLNMTSISTNNTRYTVSPTSRTLVPGDSVNIVVTYTPVVPAGTDTGRVIILSNSQGMPRKDVTLTGTSIGAPIFADRVDSLTKTLQARNLDSTRFYVRNIGTLSANYGARAVMFPRTAAGDKPGEPIIIPLEVSRVVSAPAQPLPSVPAFGAAPRRSLSAVELEAARNTFDQTLDDAGLRAFGLNLLGTPANTLVKFDLEIPGTLVSVGTSVPAYAGGFDATGSFLWAVRNVTTTSWEFGRIDTATGAFTAVGPTSALTGHTWVACKVDPSTGTVYGASTNGTLSTLYTINTTTGAATTVGTITNVPILIAMGIDNSGQIYGYDINSAGTSNSRFFRINKATAEGTLVGDMGFIGRFAQDMDFDRTNNNCYLASYNFGISPARAELRTANVTTGATTLIGVLGTAGTAEIDCFGIKGTGGSISGPWLTIAPTSGTMAINDSVQFTVKFDARGADIVSNPGTYYGRIEIYATNSSLADTLKNPVRMTVTPITGAALLATPDSIGFGNVAIGVTDSSKTFLVKNIGSATLNVTNITSSNAAFSVNRTSFSLNSNDTTRVRVRFTAPSPAGLRAGTLTFTSNDPNAPTVKLTGTSVGQANIVVTPDTFSLSLPQAPDTTRRDIRIRNTGTDTLRYTINESLTRMVDVPPPPAEVFSPINLQKGQEDPRPGYTSPLGQGGPDAFGYRWIDSDEPGGPTFSWVDISTTGTALDSSSAWVPTGTNRHNDEGYYAVRLPFSFPFYGVAKDTVFIGTNGNIMFVRPTGDVFTNNPFPTATDLVNNHFGIFWDDLEVRAGARVYYGTSGGNFVVQYQGIARFAGTVQNYTFEVIMIPGGVLKYQYLALGINGGVVNSATAGLENESASIGLTVAHNSATYFHNNLAVLISSDLLPWLSLSRTTGTIAPSDSQTVQLRFVPNQAPGTYTGRLRITGNTPTVGIVGLRLQITGGQPFVQVTAPNGGEQLNIGSTYGITWNANQVDTVTISYSTTGRTGTYTNIISVPARPSTWIHPKGLVRAIEGSILDEPLGTYNWVVPNTPSTNCFVRIVKKLGGTPGDTSDAAFTIRTAPPATDTSWVAQTSGSTATLYTVEALSSTVAWAAGTAGTVLRTTNGGTNWTSVGGGAIGTADVYSLDAVDANTAFVTTSPGATFIYKTTNGGTTWTQVYTLAAAFVDGIQMRTATEGYALGDPVGGKWLVLKTTDGGNTWARMTTEPTQVGTEAGWNNSFQLLGNTMWFGTNSSKVYRSTDLGATWSSAATTAINSYGLHFNSATLGVAGFETGSANRSTNGGTSWTVATSAGSAQNTGIAGGTGNEFWIASSAGSVYYTSNQGTGWTNAAKNGYTGAVALWAIHINAASSPNLYGWAVGATGTVLRYRRIVTGVESGPSEIPAVYALDQNFPNPFNPATTIRFALPEQATVSLKVFNLLGQEIATLAQGDMQAAFHSIVWNGRNNAGSQVASGMYFYRIEATGVSGEKFNSLKKLILLK